jgi:hypothetical protein
MIKKAFWLTIPVGIATLLLVQLPQLIHWIRYDQYLWSMYIDTMAHLMVWWLLYHLFSAMFYKKNRWIILLYSMLFALLYEFMEVIFHKGVIHWVDIILLEWNSENCWKDIIVDFVGGMVALTIEYILQRKKLEYMGKTLDPIKI